MFPLYCLFPHATSSPLVLAEMKLIDAPDYGYSLDKDPNKGELCIRGPSVFRGYFKDEEQTKQAFLPGRFATSPSFGETDVVSFCIVHDAWNGSAWPAGG